MRYVCLFVGALMLAALPASAGEIPVFRAEVSCDGCNSYNGLVVDLQDSQRNRVDSAVVGPNGGFEMRGLRHGAYVVTVRNVRGDVLHTETVNIGHGVETASIRLPKVTEPERPASGSISLARLKHKVPKEARKQLREAEKKLKRGESAAAIDHLLKAVEIDPEYMEAYNNLGSAYMQAENPAAALESFRKAAELEPSSAKVQVNVAIALMTLKDNPNGEAAARRAVELDPSDMKARYLLGLALYTQQKYTPEMIDQLRRVADVFPNAKIALAAGYAKLGDVDSARNVLRDYLRLQNVSKREQAEQMLAALK